MFGLLKTHKTDSKQSQVQVQIQVDNVTASHDSQIQDSPGIPYNSTSKNSTPCTFNGDQYEDLDNWVKINIKKKECCVFIPQESSDGEICGCGNDRESHYLDPTQPYVPPYTVWDSQKHIKERCSDAYGEMTFIGASRNWARYVRASSDTHPRELYTLMTEHWDLPAPSLLISVTGGAKNFNISPRLKTRFSRGLVKIAQSTGAWIITGGSHVGVMKHVGEAIQNFRGGVDGSGIVLLGIVPWGTVHNRSLLVRKEGGAPALYPMDVGSQGNLCCLDNNHTHFILVDDGTHGRYGIEIPLRTFLEKYISEQMMHKEETAPKIPIVCVVLNGGFGTLDTIYNSMCNSTPCIIVEGSGGIADVIAQVANLSPSKITISLIKEKLGELSSDSYDRFTEVDFITWTKKIQDIVRMGSLLTILQEEKLKDQEMDVVILQALLKASYNADLTDKENWGHQLKLAMSWNRADIAETQIFTDDWTWKPSDLYECLTVSLIEDKPSFVRLFLNHGVSLSEYLTFKTLTYLYNNTDPSSLIHRKLKRLTKMEEIKEVNVYHVSSVLKELLGGLIETLYNTDREWAMQKDVQMDMNLEIQRLDHPERDLLIWSILQNREKLAEIFWNLNKDNVVGALACYKILKALSKEEEDSKKEEKMTELANTYEKRAADVFSECYRRNAKQAQCLLTYASSSWGKTTALEMSYDSEALTFMSQGGVQMFLTKKWWGKLCVDNCYFHILLCMLFFPLIFSGIIRYRTELDALSNTSESMQKKQFYKVFKTPSKGSEVGTCTWKLKAFFTAPIVKFYYNVVSYIGFLWLFAYVLMMDFQTSPSWKEYLLYVWVFSLFTEELRQLLYDPEERGFVKKSIEYFQMFWNWVDLMALGLFTVGLICRLVHTDTVYLGRVFLSLDFMIFCIRLLHIFSVSKVLGPKIIILHRMVKDVFFFLFLLVIWIVSYGVAKQAILTTNEDRVYWIFRNVVYGPYLILFGQMPSDVDSLSFDTKKCSQNGTDPTLPKCVFNDGSQALFPEWLTIILTCLYLLMANILLLNLLIAMFGNTFQEVEDNSDQLWKLYRFGLIKEYHGRPEAPPPLILFVNFYKFLHYVIFRSSVSRHKVLRHELASENNLLSWESYIKDNYMAVQQQQDAHKQENLLKKMAECVSKDLLKTEKGSEGYQLGERLSQLEEQVCQSTRYLDWNKSALMEKGFSSNTEISVHSNSQDSQEEKATASTDWKKNYHENSRILQYPVNDENVKKTRYPVPDELVPWDVKFPGYNPTSYNDKRDGICDQNTENVSTDLLKTEKGSEGHHLEERLSQLEEQVEPPENDPTSYDTMDGICDQNTEKWCSSSKPSHKTSQKCLEVLVVKRSNNKRWSLPGGTLDNFLEIPIKVQTLLKSAYLSEFLALWKSGPKVFEGYFDDPRNTDDAWIETLAVNIHLDTQESLNKLQKNLETSDQIKLSWKVLDRKIPLYSSEKEILQRTAERLKAHY